MSRSGLCMHSGAKHSREQLMRESFDAVFDTIMDWTGAREPWQPISRPAVIAWLVFYLAFAA